MAGKVDRHVSSVELGTLPVLLLSLRKHSGRPKPDRPKFAWAYCMKNCINVYIYYFPSRRFCSICAPVTRWGYEGSNIYSLWKTNYICAFHTFQL